ncbi:netrin-4-like, partial [Antedon mediterranea]|uniref:netrin-4-like n=1 Tax=Antedon mediterranea TaxID=105859 RepID=UPI003AF9F2A0
MALLQLIFCGSYLLTLCGGQDTGTCVERACYPVFRDLIDTIANRTLFATSTCGTPENEFELRTLGANEYTYDLMICNSTIEEFAHPIELLRDFTLQTVLDQTFDAPDLSTWWQSENEVTSIQLTLSLFNDLLFQGMTIAFRSPRPLYMFIEKSHDRGSTFEPMRYFADNCQSRFPSVQVASSHSYSGYEVV